MKAKLLMAAQFCGEIDDDWASYCSTLATVLNIIITA
jgi:hypothetical protein